MYKSALVALFLSLSLSFVLSCSDLTSNSSCNTGSCASGGQLDTWTIPILPAKPAGIAASYLGRVQWDGQVLRVVYSAANPTACCARCKTSAICKYWLFVQSHPNGDSNVCFQYPVAPPTCDANNLKSNAGGKCALPGVGGDPHFMGAHGTRFDFSGMPGKSFCLLTDRSLHINMKMTGYLDERTESATSFKDGKAIRSWIRELGLIWLQGEDQHTLKLVARSTGEVQRGSGYLESAEFDGQELQKLSVGKAVTKEGGFTFQFVAYEKKGPFDVDVYNVKIEGLLDMDVRLRVAHPLLRRAEDAETHFSIAINEVASTSVIHGVLGQTYRSDRSERAVEFGKGGSVVADGESGKGFLDGVPTDYLSSDVLKADCRYTGFKGHVLPTSVSSE